MTSNVKNAIKDIRKKAKQNNVKVILSKKKIIEYDKKIYVSGYFDYNKPTKLAVAINKPQKDWIMVLMHESSHMDQWIEKSKIWVDAINRTTDSVTLLEYWIQNKIQLSDFKINMIIKRNRNLELDCERRAIKKALKYNIKINIQEEIQKANSYIYFYTMLKYSRTWYTTAPYYVKEVWSQMPKTFDNDYNILPLKIKKLFMKYCL